MPLTLAVETLSFAFVLFHGGLALLLGYASLGLDNTCLAFTFVGLLLVRNQAMQHTKAEGCAKKVKLKNFTCIVLHQMKNSLPKIQFAINT